MRPDDPGRAGGSQAQGFEDKSCGSGIGACEDARRVGAGSTGRTIRKAPVWVKPRAGCIMATLPSGQQALNTSPVQRNMKACPLTRPASTHARE